MQVRRDDLGSRFVKPLEIGDHAAEGLVGRVGFQVADVLADEHLRADRQRDGVLQMRADGARRSRISDFGFRTSSVTGSGA